MIYRVAMAMVMANGNDNGNGNVNVNVNVNVNDNGHAGRNAGELQVMLRAEEGRDGWVDGCPWWCPPWWW